MPTWLIQLDTCPSTSTWALEHAAALAHGAVVASARQTAGRGRNGSAWVAPPGTLTASLVLHLPPTVAAGPLALTAGLAVVHACEDLMPGLRLALKWPNDVQLAGRKLAGVLCERAAEGPLVVGIGLNRDPRWDGLADADALRARSASLAEAGPPPSEAALLAGIRRYLLEAAGLVAVGGWTALLPELRGRDALAGRRVQVQDGQRQVAGEACGLGEGGELLVRRPDGHMAALTGGHVEMEG